MAPHELHPGSVPELARTATLHQVLNNRSRGESPPRRAWFFYPHAPLVRGMRDALPVPGRIGFLGAGALAEMMPLVSQINTLAASLSSVGSAHAAKLAAAVEQADAAEV